MAKHTTYGSQPFKQVLRDQARAVMPTARMLGFDAAYAARVANGRTAPSRDFRERMCEFLGQPADELFTPQALAVEYVQRSNARGLPNLDGGNR